MRVLGPGVPQALETSGCRGSVLAKGSGGGLPGFTLNPKPETLNLKP